MNELSELLSKTLDDYLDKYRDQDVPGMRPVQIHIDVFPLADGKISGGNVGGSEKDENR